MLDGYASSDIDYFWAKGQDSFGLKSGIDLPTFHIVGYQQSKTVTSLSTGMLKKWDCKVFPIIRTIILNFYHFYNWL